MKVTLHHLNIKGILIEEPGNERQVSHYDNAGRGKLENFIPDI